jgi:adenine-specific DNA-methyltransferase
MSPPALVPSSKAPPQPPESGTVYTPERLAETLVRALKPKPGQTWLEPCVGEGAFLRALAQEVPPENITALDLETRTSLSDFLVSKGVERGCDFLDWASKSSEQFDRIVANPPYVALSRVPSPLRERALAVEGPDGQRVRLGANYWYAFVCASLKLLKPGASMGFILPAAWDYADYAEPLRKGLSSQFARVEVHRCLEPMFKPVNDGCVVLIARRFGESNGKSFRCEYRSLNDLVTSLSSSEASRDQTRQHSEEGTPLGKVLELRLGGVTGDSRYFVLSEEDRKRHRLPKRTCLPVVSKSRHLTRGVITFKDWERLKDEGERVWLFRPEERWKDTPAVHKYLELPASQSGCRKGFKVEGRKPWYQTPMPTPVHGFISGMSRFGPWICLSSMDGLNATNTLYVVRFLKADLLKNEQAAWALALLTSRARQSLQSIKRRYPDGLLKIEPGDLAKLRIPTPTRIEGALKQYRVATKYLLAGDEKAATRLADEWCAP